MTLFTAPMCFTGYTFKAIDSGTLAAIRTAAGHLGAYEQTYVEPLSLKLECYLQLTGKTLSLDQIGTEEWSSAFQGFAGALIAPRFSGGMAGSRSHVFAHTKVLTRVLHQLGDSISLGGFKVSTRTTPGTYEAGLAEDFNAAVLIDDRILFWRGWMVKNKDGASSYPRLFHIYERLGSFFCNSLHVAIDTSYRRGLAVKINCINELSEYIGRRPGPMKAELFKDSKWLSQFLTDFFFHFMTQAHASGKRIVTAVKEWATFALFLQSYVVGPLWCEPLKAIPRPVLKRIRGSQTNIRTSGAGFQIKRALLTDIPLELTDTQAKELLFREIQEDVDSLLRWARWEVNAAWARYQQRKTLAPHGIVSNDRSVGVSGVALRATRDCAEWLAHAAATYEARGHLTVNVVNRYPSPLNETAWDLGLPMSSFLLAHASLLVATHPQITSSFLESLQLFDKDINQTGFVETDAGFYLVGEKRRKGASTAQQQIKLTPETTKVVLQIVELTSAIREYCRANGDDSWRYLFIHVSSVGATPGRWSPSKEASRRVPWLATRFELVCGLDTAPALSLASRFSLKRLRSSAAVLIYLKTGSVQRMAEALGHECWHPRLLDHYLPSVVQEFFVERWIKLFQLGIICEALKDSPYLAHASSFSTMDELDEFLENHALKRIPLHLQDPDHLLRAPVYESLETRILFGIDAGVLTLLLSLERAVAEATEPVCGRARRWALISRRLMPHVALQPEFASMLVEAQKHVDPAKMVPIIYG